MERLSKRISESLIELSAKANPIQYNGSPQMVHIKHPFWNVFNKLCDYEDAEEHRLLLRLPCKVGDVVYQITRDFISEFKIKTFVCDGKSFFFHWQCIKGIYVNVIGFHSSMIGKDVFLTKEEAEQALAKMKEGVMNV